MRGQGVDVEKLIEDEKIEQSELAKKTVGYTMSIYFASLQIFLQLTNVVKLGEGFSEIQILGQRALKSTLMRLSKQAKLV